MARARGVAAASIAARKYASGSQAQASSTCPLAQKASTLLATVSVATGSAHEASETDLDELCQSLSQDGTNIKQKTLSDYIGIVFRHFSNDAQLNVAEYFGSHHLHGEASPTITIAEMKETLLSSEFSSYVVHAGRRDDDTSVDRKALVNVLQTLQANNDALGTLPVTLVYLLVFMTLVQGHLRIHPRQRLQQAVESWVQGSGDLAGPFIERDVFDVDTFWTWLDKSGVGSVFGEPRNISGVEVPRIAVATDIIGDVALRRTIDGGDVESKYLLANSPLTSGSMTERAHATINELRTGVWKDSSDVSTIALRWSAYNSRVKMFVFTDVKFQVSKHGTSFGQVMATSVLPSSNIGYGLWIANVIFIAILLFITVMESRDICLAIRHGLQTFKAHWQLWNVVDFASIVMGWINIGLLVWCIMLMRADSIASVCDDDGNLKTSVMSLPTSALDDISTTLEDINSVFFMLHIVVAVNSLTIVFRLFKAFQANLRLRVVTDTFLQAYTDISHFFIVFLTILGSFAVIGHVLFGNDLVEFYDLAASISSSFVVLMGEFDWYVKTSMQESSVLPSGIPRFLVTLWFWSFMILISLVMLNMLLAIILDKHAAVAEAEDRGGEASPTIWAQMIEFVKTSFQTMRYIPISHLVAKLEVDAHPDDRVTKASLQEAFEGMGNEQADWLMHLLKREVRRRVNSTIAAFDPCVKPLKRSQRALKLISAEAAEIVNTLEANCAQVDRVEKLVTTMLQQQLGDPTRMGQVGVMSEIDAVPLVPVGSKPFSHSKLSSPSHE
eukprot:TRINITY_DN5525_c0_g3_i1.p1 TRINITY_DN5525_c0_g3~~TRINITY_DN5525_c0_g3_i1.p1  ORF type:complete len:803 (+),score=140.35 TRINITY_DN5525_c0_g3_i1:58-2409(+)